MKKIISTLSLLLVLCGCSHISENDAINKLDNIFSNYVYEASAHRRNNNTSFYSFYLPSDIYEIEYDDTYHHLVFNASDFAMNLNTNYILCENVFLTTPEDSFNLISNYAVYEKDNFDNNDKNKYKFCLYKIDGNYFFSFYTNTLIFFGTSNLDEIDELVKHLFIINNSVVLDTDKIIDSYYSGTTIDYTQPQFELFNRYIPPEGTLDILLDQDDIDNKIDEPIVEDVQEDENISSEGE